MEFLLHAPWWIWLLVSVIPYSIKQRQTSNMQSLVLSALFWQFSLIYQKRQYSWSFSLPWIKQMQRSRYLRAIFTSTWAELVQVWVKKVISFWR